MLLDQQYSIALWTEGRGVKNLNLASSVEIKIIERVTSRKNIYLISIDDDIVTQ